jgi:hypothetical protein
MWSNDGRRLAYALPEDPDVGTFEVWTYDTETSEKRLLSPEITNSWPLGWTAAGDVLVVNPESITLLGNTSRTFPLPEPGVVIDSAISPDGRTLAAELGEYEYREEEGLTYIHSGGIWTLGLTGGGWREVLDLGEEPPAVQTTGGGEMRWSPDGRRIALHRTRVAADGVLTDGLSVLDVRTGEETRVHEEGWGWEAWSPDGGYLAFTRYAGDKPNVPFVNTLSLLNPTGDTRDVDAAVRGFAWAANGRLLLDIPARLSLLDPETMGIEEIDAGDGETIGAFIEGAVWSPSRRYVALSTPSDQYHRSSLYIVDTEEATATAFYLEAGFSPVAWVRE